jgi:hypothetical protein
VSELYEAGAEVRDAIQDASRELSGGQFDVSRKLGDLDVDLVGIRDQLTAITAVLRDISDVLHAAFYEEHPDSDLDEGEGANG